MNKTLSINLANIIFNIDENAYSALQRYLEAVKKYLTGKKGSEEILADVEARIAELFQEKLSPEKQVIVLTDVEAIIKVMGQPEDYSVDDDIFEENPKQNRKKTEVKKLYRDSENKLLAGVCAGIGHYLRIDPLWVRLLFIVFLFGGGFSVLTYIILWVIVPEANTTAQKLDMQGEAANLSNIEKKIKEGFETVSEKVKNVDYDGIKKEVNQSGNSFIKGVGDAIALLFSTLGKIITTIFNVFGKFVGIILILIGTIALLGLFFGLFTIGILDLSNLPGIQIFPLVNDTVLPMWVLSILLFFAIGIPFYSLLYIGLTVLSSNLKKMGNISKLSLLGVWLLSIGTLLFFGVRQANSYSIRGNQMQKTSLFQNQIPDTLFLKANSSEHFEYLENHFFNGITISYDTNDKEVLYSKNVRVNIKNAYEEKVTLKTYKSANGYSYKEAKKRANAINYKFDHSGNHLSFDNYFISDTQHKMRDQKIDMTLLITTGTVIKIDTSMRDLMGWETENDQDMYRKDLPDHLWKMNATGVLECTDCNSDSQ